MQAKNFLLVHQCGYKTARYFRLTTIPVYFRIVKFASLSENKSFLAGLGPLSLLNMD